VKPFWFWAQVIGRYEYPVIAGFIVSVVLLFIPSRVPRMIRLFGLYGIGVFLAYSIVPYKTAWCVVNFIWPFYFPLAYALGAFLDKKPQAVITAVAVLAVVSFAASWELNFIHYEDYQEPYAYVQTVNKINNLLKPLYTLAKEDPGNFNLKGFILRTYDWPLPWCLGEFKRVIWYDGHNRPPYYDADFLLVGRSNVPDVEDHLKQNYFIEPFALRAQDQDASSIYFSEEKFKDYFKGRTPEFKPRPPKPLIPGQGLNAAFYARGERGGPSEERPLLHQEIVSRIDFAWEGDARPHPFPFEAAFTGEILISKKEQKFVLATDDGGTLEIDGVKIIDDPGPHSCKDKEGVVKGEPGWKKIRVWFYDIGGGAVVRLLWESEPGVFVLVPAESLRPAQTEVKG
jgi:hypothetical protein